MSIFNKYPYTDFHEMNLDWLIREIKELKDRMDDFTVINKLIYAGAWDISKNYPPYNIVISDETGYISIKSVPAGISIYNSEYWVKIADFTAEMAAIVQQLDTLIEDVEGLDILVDDLTTRVNNLYPVGSVIVRKSNDNPSDELPGTWVLEDKQFAYSYSESMDNFIRNTAEISSIDTPIVVRAGNELTLRLRFTNINPISAVDLTVGNWNLNKLGVTDLYYAQRFCGYSADGDAVLMCNISPDGTFKIVNVVPKGTATTMSANCECNAECSFVIDEAHMLNSACDKFYFRRTS